MKDASADPAASQPASERVMRVPASAIARTAAAGAKSAIQATAILRDDPSGDVSELQAREKPARQGRREPSYLLIRR